MNQTEMKPSRMSVAKTRTRKPMVMQLLEENVVCEYADKVMAAPTNPIANAFVF